MATTVEFIPCCETVELESQPANIWAVIVSSNQLGAPAVVTKGEQLTCSLVQRENPESSDLCDAEDRLDLSVGQSDHLLLGDGKQVVCRDWEERDASFVWSCSIFIRG